MKIIVIGLTAHITLAILSLIKSLYSFCSPLNLHETLNIS